jgi:hypothetical protein
MASSRVLHVAEFDQVVMGARQAADRLRQDHVPHILQLRVMNGPRDQHEGSAGLNGWRSRGQNPRGASEAYGTLPMLLRAA